MKNLNKIALICALSVSAAAATTATKGNFTGFYAGAGLGLTKKKVQTDPQNYTSEPAFSLAVFGGYGHQMNNLYLGAELALKNDFKKTKIATTEFNESVAVALNPRIGYAMDSFLFYVKPGFEYSKAQLKLTTTGAKSKKVSKFVFAPGLGVEYKVNKNLFTRFEYNYKKNDFKFNTAKFTRTSHNLTLGVGYIF